MLRPATLSVIRRCPRQVGTRSSARLGPSFSNSLISTAALSFTDTAPIVALLRSTVEAVARQVHPKAGDPWAQFSLPDGLLLAERLCRDIRRELLSHVPGVRAMRLSHLLWVQRQSGRYGALARIGWRIGYGLWRLTRTALHPLQGVVQEVKDMVVQHTEGVLTQRLRSYATRLLIIETGRAAIDLYSGRLALSEEEVRLASASDMAAFKTSEPGPVRILLAGQVNAGKSSLLNAMAQQPRVAIGPLPTTAAAEDHAIAVEGHPAVVIVDTPGLGDDKKSIAALTRYAARCDLVVWVASATQPARGPDRGRPRHAAVLGQGSARTAAGSHSAGAHARGPVASRDTLESAL